MSRRDDLIALRDKVQAGKWRFNGWESHPINRKSMGKLDDAYSGSVDAALALLAAVLPGWHVQHVGQTRAGWVCRIEGEGLSIPYSTKFEPQPTAARALLLATLNALIAEADT